MAGDLDSDHTRPEGHQSTGDQRRNDRKQLATVANDPYDAEDQGGGKREHYQQRSKRRERAASAGLAQKR